SGILAVLTLVAAGRRKRSMTQEVMFFGCLILVMLLASPVCHLHYFALALPLVMALLAQKWKPLAPLRQRLLWWTFFGLFFLANAIPQIPALHLTRDIGLAMWGAIVLWTAGVANLWAGPQRTTLAAQQDGIVSASAA